MEEKRVSSIISWFRQRFGNQRSDPERAESCSSSQCSPDPYNSSKDPSLNKPFPSNHQSIISSSSGHLPSSSSHTLPAALSSPFRWSLSFDLCVCHAESDKALAHSLTCFLESPAYALRCFLRHRDCSPGGAISTELLQALQESHCCLLLLSPGFLRDRWCQYQMQQALCEGPVSERIIPAVLELSYSELPPELRFVSTLNMNENPEHKFAQVYRTVISYLKDMSENGKMYQRDET
ncbi:hypothetical protein DNTS_003570 [Danionella cerebrum]|uniref:TIR domain-containing protein n=1 Tax=Danionella cerebrum TaxID=2873325 RepID=A0A553PZH6_9TELE|nr:hypothetical protein DNTS_003570 [Danionella translucida]